MTQAALAAMVTTVMIAPAAQGAFVRPEARWVWAPYSAEPTPRFDVIYDGEGSEANDITVAAAARAAIVITDPGTGMHSGESIAFASPERVPAMWACETPGSSTAVCAVTPGSACWAIYCDYTPGVYEFSGRLKIAGNKGDDRIKILQTPFESMVWGVYGNDAIDVANSSLDNVDCGTGTDSVRADAGDRVQPSCEIVTRVG